jgi:hypothetical protein
LFPKGDGRTKKQLLSCIFCKKKPILGKGKASIPKYTPPIEVLIKAGGGESSKNKKIGLK